ncbi:hypothetical protein A3SI_10874 [Nitritalea halalkaliphila LW7]|uniref:Uncharacterized protein n=1 Tax=Nitritalea halalkaliphila LW7 TaxID=1189621 RepID=I5C3A7_9BACT|nr:hypothetical protein [Nitritalea halalkaliphila]EIM76309.1 hypothetical protein A3SI_10874 [Nitritalea halalkaliphila LW7]
MKTSIFTFALILSLALRPLAASTSISSSTSAHDAEKEAKMERFVEAHSRIYCSVDRLYVQADAALGAFKVEILSTSGQSMAKRHIHKNPGGVVQPFRFAEGKNQAAQVRITHLESGAQVLHPIAFRTVPQKEAVQAKVELSDHAQFQVVIASAGAVQVELFHADGRLLHQEVVQDGEKRERRFRLKGNQLRGHQLVLTQAGKTSFYHTF